MNYPQNLSASDCKWLDLIQECRSSGKSDRQWLAENNISSPTFYYHIKKLRKKSCDIPMKSDSIVPEIQEVVPLVLKEGSFPEKTVTMQDSHRLEVDTAIRLTINGISVEITNHATQTAIQNTLSALRYLC